MLLTCADDENYGDEGRKYFICGGKLWRRMWPEIALANKMVFQNGDWSD